MQGPVSAASTQRTTRFVIMKCSAFLVVVIAIVYQLITGISSLSYSTEVSHHQLFNCPCKIVNSTFTDCSYLKLTSIPAGIPKSTETLLLSHNKIHPISSSSFAGLVNLRFLDMSYNSFSSLSRDYFTDQTQLQHLYLSHNQINKIPPNAFMSVTKLKTLDLSYQNNYLKKALSDPSYLDPLNETLETLLLEQIGIVSAAIEGTLKLKSLKVLSLARNSIAKLSQNDFKALSGLQLERLDLSYNSISAINTDVFSTILSIDTLNFTRALGETPQPGRIADISLAVGTKVKKLILRSLGLKSLSSSMFRGLQNSTLEELDLSYNQISGLSNDSFGSYLSHLKILQLFSNSITNISQTALTGLTSLITLDLFNNKLTVIYPGTFAKNGHLQTLYLNNNALKGLSQDGSFKGLFNLQKLDLAYNVIVQTITGEEFQDLGELLNLDITNNFKDVGISLTGNSFKLLSKLNYLRLKKIKLLDISSPSPFANLLQLRFLDLSNNNMHGLQPDTFLTLKSLQTLYLDHNHLNNLWYQPKSEKPVMFLKSLVSLRTLDLSYNGLQGIPQEAFSDLSHLRALHLSNNKLSTISGAVFYSLKELQYIDLHKNLINVVNETLLTHILKTLKSVYICSNPFSCGCKQEWFRDWIDETNITVGNISTCLCDSPPDWRNKPLLDFHPEVLNCDGKIPLKYWIIIGVGSFLTLVFLIFLIAHRWKCYYIFLLVKARHRRTRQRDYDRLNPYNYDAFISHSGADNDWVRDTLVPKLENGENPFTVCHHERDFEPGQEIIDNIIESVNNSRRTICVITKSYLESNWCTYERRVTMSKLFINYKDALILIILEDIPDKKMSKYDLIHRAVKKKTYLKWPVEDGSADERAVFWRRLKTVLGEDRNPVNYGAIA